MVLWFSERSTYHATMVNRVRSHLKRTCTQAEKEIGLVKNRITDAAGYDAKTKTYYLCEIKVNFNDLQKAVYQIHDTAFRYKPKIRGSSVIPVIAFPGRLYKELIKFDNWKSLKDICKKIGVAVWVIEQSSIRQVQRPKPKSPSAKKFYNSKTTPVVKTAVKSKTTSKSRTVVKSKYPPKAKLASAKVKAVKKKKGK